MIRNHGMVKPLLDVEPALGAFVGHMAGFSWTTKSIVQITGRL